MSLMGVAVNPHHPLWRLRGRRARPRPSHRSDPAHRGSELLIVLDQPQEIFTLVDDDVERAHSLRVSELLCSNRTSSAGRHDACARTSMTLPCPFPVSATCSLHGRRPSPRRPEARPRSGTRGSRGPHRRTTSPRRDDHRCRGPPGRVRRSSSTPSPGSPSARTTACSRSKRTAVGRFSSALARRAEQLFDPSTSRPASPAGSCSFASHPRRGPRQRRAGRRRSGS